MNSSFQKTTLVCTFSLFASAMCFAAGPKGKAIEFSEPRNERGITNTQGLTPGRSSLDRMEAELNGPLKTILRGNSLEGMIMPAPQMMPPPALQPRNRDLMDRKHDKMYLTPEDLYSVKSIEDVYKAQEMTADGRTVKNLRPMERWIIETLKAGHGSNQTTTVRAGSSTLLEDKHGLSGQTSLNPADNLLRKELRKVFGLDATAASRDRGSREMSGPGDGFNSQAGISQEEFQRRESFMQNLDPNYIPALAGAARGGSGFSTPFVNSSFYDPPKSAPLAPAPVMTATPVTPGVQPDLWKASFVQPAPVAKPEPTPAPVSPFINSPRRSF